MKKFFVCLLLTGLSIFPRPAQSGIQSAAEAANLPAVNQQARIKELQKLYQEIPDLNDKEAVAKYVQKRLSIVSAANISPEELNSPSATSVVDTEKLKQNAASTLSAYEQIYNESLAQAESNGTLNENVKLDGTFYRLKEQENAARPFVPDFPYITVKLSDTKEILAPAEEHIAYMLTTLNIEPTGLLKVTEEFVFVSNNESFPLGFFRILPKYAYSLQDKRRLDLTLDSVTVNGQEYPYKITEIGDFLYIEPKEPLQFPTGVYTYRFNYLIDRAVWFYDNYDAIYWDITARTLRNVVGSANAVAILPEGKTFMEQNAFASTKQGLDPQRVTITTLAENSLGFADTEALDISEDIHLVIHLEKGTIVPPDFAKKYMWYIHDYGAVLFALLAFIAIFISYKISSIQIRRNQDKTRVSLKKTPALFRLINCNTFDKKSFGAEILSLCSKNILELQARENTIVLFKKTDNLQKLDKSERKFLVQLFPNAETTLPATPESGLKLERAYKFLKKNTFFRLNFYKLRLNGLYLIFSVSMLLCGIIGAAALAVNPSHTFLVISGGALLMAGGIIGFSHRFHNKYLNICIKTLLVLEILCIGGWIAIYTSNLYAVILLLTIGTIFSYYRLFARRNGLLRSKIKETDEYKLYLQKNTELTQNSRDFNIKLPYILAFGLESKYPQVSALALVNCLLQQIPTHLVKD